MTTVEFHTLEGEADGARLRLACSLVERCYLDGQQVLVWLDDAAAMASFDNLLWTFGDRAFVPHEPLPAEPGTCEAPVQLTSASKLPESIAGSFQTLVHLRHEANDAALLFDRVIEVVDAQAERRNAGRARFRYYRERGIEPQHFKDG